MNNEEFNKLTINELKALAYDELAIQERTRNNLNIINKRILELSQAKPQEHEVTEEVKEEPEKSE